MTRQRITRQRITPQAITRRPAWQRLHHLSPGGSHRAPSKRRTNARCCKDVGWLYAADAQGQAIFDKNRVKLVRCVCQNEADLAKNQRYLMTIDGLSAADRSLRFGDLAGNRNQSVLRHVEESVRRGHGLLTLMGKPGVGKSTMLMCAVNAAREANMPAVYTTVTDLLVYLRQAFDPSSELPFDARWQMLVGVQVLALDELDEFSTTPWAMERFLRLIDERWRAMDRSLTLCATNHRVHTLPEKVASRLRDGRARYFELEGADMRPYQESAV